MLYNINAHILILHTLIMFLYLNNCSIIFSPLGYCEIRRELQREYCAKCQLTEASEMSNFIAAQIFLRIFAQQIFFGIVYRNRSLKIAMF